MLNRGHGLPKFAGGLFVLLEIFFSLLTQGLPKQKAYVIKKPDTNSMTAMETATAVCMKPRSNFYVVEQNKRNRACVSLKLREQS